MEDKRSKDADIRSLRGFLIARFLIVLIATSIAEILISSIVGTAMNAVVRSIVGTEITFSFGNSLFPFAGILVLMILGQSIPGLSVLTGNAVSWLEQQMFSGIEGTVVLFIQKMPVYLQLLLLFGLLMLIILYLLPILVGAGVYVLQVQRKMLELEQKQKEIYEEYEKKRSLMLADIAHDLRNPITAVYGYAQALTDGLITDPEEQKEYLQVIMAKSGRINDLIQLLFDYTKLDSPGFTLNKKELDLCELLRQNAALIYPDMEEHGMILEADIPEQPYMVSADEMQLSRVITNLLTNAIRHNPSGTRVLLSFKKTAETAEITVADSGTEVPAELAEHLFEPFAMGDKSRNSGGGSGLGLAIAHKVAEMHGWKLCYDPVCEGYTKAFRICIPAGDR